MFFISIDVSKAKLDCSLLLDVAGSKRKSKSVANSKAGAADLLALCAKHTVVPADLQAIMEGTGIYHQQAALALFDLGVTISIVNPAFMPLGCKPRTLAKAWVSAPKPMGLRVWYWLNTALCPLPSPDRRPPEVRELSRCPLRVQALLSRRETVA